MVLIGAAPMSFPLKFNGLFYPIFLPFQLSIPTFAA